MQAVFQTIADFWWLAPLVGFGAVAYRFLGWRGLLAVVTLGIAGGVYTKGKTDERERNKRADAERDRKAVEDRSKVENEISKLDPDTKRKRLAPWMRD
jgi:hypothetical protein